LKAGEATADDRQVTSFYADYCWQKKEIDDQREILERALEPGESHPADSFYFDAARVGHIDRRAQSRAQ